MVELIAVSAVLVYFASAIVTYFIHGLLQDTDNQLKPPFTSVNENQAPKWMLGSSPRWLVFVLFYGVVIAVL